MTLPGALDIEYNPYGSECYGFTRSQMKAWIQDFVTEYAYKEHVYPVIYSTTDWWTTCTGNHPGLATRTRSGSPTTGPVRRPAANGLGFLHVLAVRGLGQAAR